MTGDVGEDFEAYRKMRKEKKEKNREQSTELLTKKGIAFTSHNAGVHLVVTGRFGNIDFWPSTGKWTTRYQLAGKRITRRGIKHLITEVNRT